MGRKARERLYVFLRSLIMCMYIAWKGCLCVGWDVKPNLLSHSLTCYKPQSVTLILLHLRFACDRWCYTCVDVLVWLIEKLKYLLCAVSSALQLMMYMVLSSTPSDSILSLVTHIIKEFFLCPEPCRMCGSGYCFTVLIGQIMGLVHLSIRLFCCLCCMSF